MNTETDIDLHAVIARALGESNGHRPEAVIAVIRPEMARLEQRITELTEERDRARRWAEALERQLHRERELTGAPEPGFDEAGEKL